MEFTLGAWPIIERGTTFRKNWHHEVIAAHLEAVLDGRVRDLIVTVPPRHTKSTLTSIAFPAFAWTKRPELRFLFASFKEALALDHSQAARDIIASEWYRTRWPHVEIRGDQDTKAKFANTRTGYRIAASVDSSSTGTGGDILVVDDAHALADAYSDLDRERAVRWWNTTMSSRLNDRQTGARIVIGQRVHEADLIGNLLRQTGWTHVNLPAEYVPSKTFSSPIGAGDPRKEAGELLWPEKFPASVQETIRRENGEYAYSAQQQQDPQPAEGGMFSAKYFRYFTEEGGIYSLEDEVGKRRRFPLGNLAFFQVFDTAIKEVETVKDDPDFTVCLTVCLTPDNDLLVVDVVRLRIPVPEQYRFTVRMRNRFPSIAYQFVEDKASGQGLVQEGRTSPHPFLNLKDRLKDKGITDFFGRDKQQRAVPVSILYETGKVYHLAGAPWVRTFESELLHFPVGAHDDQVDAVAYAAICMKYGPRYRSPAEFSPAEEDPDRRRPIRDNGMHPGTWPEDEPRRDNEWSHLKIPAP